MSDQPADPSATPKPVPAEPKPKRERTPSSVYLVITDDTVTVYGREIDALRSAFKIGARVVTTERAVPVKLKE